MILGMNMNRQFKETRQRELILLILQGTTSHPTADWIYDEARKKMPQISKSTVYRNLGILLERGEITALNLNGTITRYEIKQNPHYHFRCEQCGQVFDLQHPVKEDLDRKVEANTGFKVKYHQLEFRGICQECQKQQASCIRGVKKADK
jgi:Fur family transcriptional regulator, peroxide stress response regulator